MSKRERQREACRRWREKHRERHLASQKANYERRKQDETQVKRARANAHMQKYKRYTPAWADCRAIRAFYENRPEGMTVDHIIPLKSETVTGLHVLANLQYLTPAENRAKGNSYG